MDQNFKIRNANLRDVEIIFGFIGHLEEKSFDYEKFKEKFKENIENPDILYLVAVGKEDEVIGFISAHGQNPLRLDGKLFEIQEMYVLRNFRGRGIEKMLFSCLEETLSKLYCERIEVSAEINRIEVKKFYSKLGFNGTMATFVKIY